MSLNTVSPTGDRTFKLNALQIAKGATWYSLATVAGMILEYVIQGIVAVQLGPTGFGIFSIGLQVFGIILVLSVLALPNALIYFIPGLQKQNDTESVGELISTSFWLSLSVSLLVSSALFLAAKPIAAYLFDEPELAIILRLLALAVPGAALVSLLTGVLRGLKLTWQASLLTQFYERALRFLFILLFLWMGIGLRGPALAYLPASLLVAMLGLFHLRRFLRFLVLARPTSLAVSRLLRYSGPLFLSQLLSHSRAAVQPLILAYFLDARTVGLYAGALLFIRVFAMVLTALNFFYLPVVSEVSTEGDMVRVRRLYCLVTRWSLILVLPTCLLVLLLPQSFLGLLGNQYLDGSWVLRITSIGVVINMGVGTVGTTLLATGRTRAYLYIDIFGTIVSLLLGFLLVPAMGLIGAAVAQVLTAIIWNGSTLLVVYKLYRMQPFSRHYLSIFLTALGSVSLLYPLIWLAGDHYPGLIVGAIAFATALTVAVLLRFRLLDMDSQIVAREFWTRARTRLVAVQTHLFDILK